MGGSRRIERAHVEKNTCLYSNQKGLRKQRGIIGNMIGLRLCLIGLLLSGLFPVRSGLGDALPMEVRFHPDGPLSTGDWVSVEVFATPEQVSGQSSLLVFWEGQKLGEASFLPMYYDTRYSATLLWFWNTEAVAPGEYSLLFEVQPQGLRWTETVRLEPAVPGVAVYWKTAETPCCRIHYLATTEAERDIAELQDLIERNAQQIQFALGVESPAVVDINLFPRMVGHGGFSGTEVYLTYASNLYSGAEFERVVRHELIHRYDLMAVERGRVRPALLAEGLAVYLSGGHYKAEPLAGRAAALLQFGWYVPLASLADDFYNVQHEVAYLEAAAFVEYLARTYGWQAYLDFHRDISEGGKPSQVVDEAIQAHFGMGLRQMEDRFVAFLDSQPCLPDLADDVRLTVQLFDALRAYQQRYAPSSYFRSAWLPDVALMRQRQIVADYLQAPDGEMNQLLEAKLREAGLALRSGRFSEVQRLIREVRLVLYGQEPGVSALKNQGNRSQYRLAASMMTNVMMQHKTMAPIASSTIQMGNFFFGAGGCCGT
jgi:hypothetical protein